MHIDLDHLLLLAAADVGVATFMFVIRHIPRAIAAFETHGDRPAIDVLSELVLNINPWLWLRYVGFGLLIYVIVVPAFIVGHLTGDRTLLLMAFNMPTPGPPGELILALPCVAYGILWPCMAIGLTRSKETREILTWLKDKSDACEAAKHDLAPSPATI